MSIGIGVGAGGVIGAAVGALGADLGASGEIAGIAPYGGFDNFGPVSSGMSKKDTPYDPEMTRGKKKKKKKDPLKLPTILEQAVASVEDIKLPDDLNTPRPEFVEELNKKVGREETILTKNIKKRPSFMDINLNPLLSFPTLLGR